MSQLIDTKAKRDRLAKRREPYWHKIILGGFLGYRVGSKGGSWIARYRDENGKQHYKSLELPIHYALNEFDCAIGEAKGWFDSLQQGYSAAPGSMQEVVDNYIEYLEQNKGQRAAADARGRTTQHILPYFRDIPLSKLTPQKIRKWLHSFVAGDTEEEQRKSKATANRNLTVLKAMLNLAYREGIVLSDRPWKAIGKFKNTDFARKDFLTPEQVTRLLGSTEGNFHDLLKAAALTGARYGELCKLKVSDFDKNNGLLNIPSSKTSPRTFPLASSTKQFFQKVSKSKLPSAPLLTKNGTDPWGHGDQTKPMKEAVLSAELSDTIVFYTLRHSFIADVIDKNMNVFDIAKITGTSIEMIEKHYGKLFKGRVIEVLERTSLVI